MPTFKTSPDADSSARSPYDDLNRLERNQERNDNRNNDRNPERDADRNAERNVARQPDRAEERNAADLRAQDRNGRDGDRDVERNHDREPERAAAKAVQQVSRKSAEGTDPLIQGLFSKLPEPSTEWALPARQKWLQTAANIFDLMYAPSESNDGELVIRVERTSPR